MYDQIIFVEGPSDEQILREFAKTLSVNLGQLNTGFIQMNGVRNLGHYAAAEVVSFLTKRRVKLHFLVDADEATSIHFQRLRDEFGTGAKVHILSKREIENYLLSPSANIRHLVTRKRMASQESFLPPEEPAFRELELKAAESLKDLAIWKRILATTSRPLYPKARTRDCPDAVPEMKERARKMLETAKSDADAIISNLDKLCEDARDTVENDWLDKRLDIVPGSAILDEVYKTFTFRYDKMRDGAAVASYIHQSEIEAELRDFLRGLSS